MRDAGFRDLGRLFVNWLRKWRHPLWWLPDVPSEQDASYRAIWSQIRSIDRVVDGRHDKSDFLQRSGNLVIVCARIDPEILQPAFQDLMATLTEMDYVRPVSPSYYNITVQELGYLSQRPNGRDEITELWLNEYLEQCQSSLRDFWPFDVRLGGANSYMDAAILDVHDGGGFSRIHEVLVDFVSQPPQTRYPYLPEFVIAQYTKNAPIGRLMHNLTPFRDTTFGEFRVQHIDVIRIPTTEAFGDPILVRSYQLDTPSGFIDRVTRPDPR